MKNPIAKYLMCSYAYYVEDNPLVSDDEFVTISDLEAGTYLGHYPSMVKGAVRSWRMQASQ